MSYKNQALRALVVERLAVAADEIFALFERTFAEYEEEVLRSKLLQETRVELLPVLLPAAPPDVHQSPEQTEEDQPLRVKKEEEPPVELPFAPLPLKHEENADKEEPADESKQETIEKPYAAEEPGCSLHLRPDDDERHHSGSDTDDSEDWEPCTKRSTKSDGQDSDLVLIEDSNTDVSPAKREEEKPARSSEPTNLQPKSDAQTPHVSSDAPEPESAAQKPPETNGKRSKRDRKKLDPDQLKCTECGKQFKRGAYLRKHMLYHSNPTRCEHCGKTFRYKSQLDVHLRCHTKEKPFSCSLCKQKFSQNYYLIRHMKNHDGKKPHTCPECGVPFKQQYNLSRHIAVVHKGEKRFNCPVCKKAFSQKKDCESHTTVHSEERPFGCSACGKYFRDKGYLRKHMRMHKRQKNKPTLIYCKIDH